MKFILKFAYTVAAITILTSCTRKDSQRASTLKILIPQTQSSTKPTLSALSLSGIKVLVVNVSGPGLTTPLSYSWNEDAGSELPDVITMAVPQGTSRAIQVVVGLKKNNGVSLYYGNTTTDLTTAETSVSVDVYNLSSGIKGRIAGRYLTSSASGPTDLLQVLLTPPGSTLPPVLLHQSEMIGGYFNVFAFSDVALTYQLADGTNLFPPGSQLEPVATNPLNPANNSTSLIYVPPSYRSDGNQDDAVLLLLGYFGPSATPTNNRVCFDYPSGPIANAYLNSAHSTAIPWTSTTSTLATLANQSAGVLAGSSLVSCSGTALTNYLQIKRDLLASGNNLIPFRGPYTPITASNYLTFTDVAGNLLVTWAYAPDVFSGVNPITGSHVFYRTPAGGSNFETENGFRCSQLPTLGFTSLSPSVGASALSTTIPSQTTSSDIEVVVCPYRQDGSSVTYFKQGIGGHPTSAAFTGTPPFHLMLSSTAVSPGTVVTPLDSIPHTAITNVTLQIVDAQNRAVVRGSGATLNLSLGYPLLTFDGSSDSTTVTLDAQGKSTFPIHVGNNELVSTLTATQGGSISGLPTTNIVILPVGPWTGEPVNLMVHTTMAGAPSVGQCVPIEYSIGDGSLGTLNPSTTNITFQPTSPGGTFYTAPDCTGAPASSITIPAGNVMAYLYFSPATNGMLTLDFTGSPTNATPAALTLFGSPSLYVP